MKKLCAALLCVIMVFTTFVGAFAVTSDKTRDFVLVLDTSGSMSGNPLRSVIDASKKMINAIFTQSPKALISIVGYSSDAYRVCDYAGESDTEYLYTMLNRLSSGGGTYMSAALNQARDIISSSNAESKTVIFMSDGEPSDSLEEIESAAMKLHRYADVYSVGFFSQLDSSRIRQAENVLRMIASDRTKFYSIEDSSDFQFVFEDIADETTLDYKRIIVWIDCPVDVEVSYRGERLDKSNTRTSYGSLLFEGDNNESKILRLDPQNNYDVRLLGTGSGTMDYAISYPNADGQYYDKREFKYVPITRGMIITSNTEQRSSTTLEVDKNGDGYVDETYSAKNNEPCNFPKPVLSISTYKGTYVVSESSYVVNNNPKVDGAKVSDNDYVTAWNVRSNTYGVGEWVNLAVRDADNYRFDGFDIYNGYNKISGKNDYWQLNTRVRELDVYCDNRFVETFTLLDSRNRQTFFFTTPQSGSSLRFEIVSVYKGDKYKDACITEIIPF